MAKKKTEMQVTMKGKGIKSTAKNVKNTRKETEKLDKSQDKLSGSTNRYHKLQKGVAQAGANSTKNFSKMNQTLGGSGGSSGLVAAYATLAANVFAATAAFGALQRAAEFENLKKGLHELGHQSGRTLSILADGLRDVTGGALSAEEAMRGAALGISGGFGGAELEGLAKIAKGASITLGRNLPDAFDRLTRGAIKLEPEILDELGIMVRVDEAAENYATQLGKTVGSMTQMEKRQAFMNEILVQGEAKFGEIADAVEPDPYTKLGATFADLTKDIFTFINETLMLGNIVEFLSENVTVLAGVMLLFGSTIASKMLPFLADGAAAAHAQAEKMAALAEATLNAGKAQQALSISQLGSSGGKHLAKGYLDTAAAIKEGGAEMEDLLKLQKSLNGSIGHYSSKAKMGAKISSTANKQRLVGLEMEKQKLAQIIAMEQGRHIDMLKFNKLQAASIFADDAAIAISNYTSGVQGLGASFGDINKGFGTYVKNIDAAKEALLENGATLTMSQKLMTRLGGVTKWLGKQFRLMGAAIMKSIVPIALIVIAIGAAIALWNKFYNTKEQKAYQDGLEEMKQLIDEMAEKVEKMNKAWDNTKNLADGQVRAYEIQSGLLSEITSKMKDQVKLRREADGSRPRPNSLGMWSEDPTLKQIEEGRIPASIYAGEIGAAAQLGNLDAQMTSSLLQIKDSDEWLAAKSIFESGIPDAVALMQSKAKAILKDGIGEMNPQEFADLWAKAVREVESAFGNLGPSASQLRLSFKELEKESSKFLSQFGKKTSVDGFVLAFEAVDKAFAEFKKSVKDDAGVKEWEVSMGRALLDITGKTAVLMGPAFEEAQDSVFEITRLVQIMKDDTGKTVQELRKGTDAEKELIDQMDKALINLYNQSGEYGVISKEVKQIQRLELMRQRTMTTMNKLQKAAQKLTKAGLNLQGKEFKIEERKLKIQKELAQSNMDLISKEFMGLKKIIGQQKTVEQGYENGRFFYTEKIKNITKDIELQDFLNMSYHEQNKLLEENSVGTKLLNDLRTADYDQRVRSIEILRAEMGVQLLGDKEKAEALKKELDMKKKLMQVNNNLAEVELRLTNYKEQGTTELDAGDEAKLKVDAAIAEFEHAKLRAAAERAIIDAKAGLQKVDLFIINKQIDLANLMTKQLISEQEGIDFAAVDDHIAGMGKSPLIDRISETRVDQIEGDIDKLAKAGKDLVDAEAKLLGRQVELAISDGLINIVKALESGEIDFGKAISDQFDLRQKRGKTGSSIFPQEMIDDLFPEGIPGEEGDKEFSLQDSMKAISGSLAPFKKDLAEISAEGAGMSQFIGGIEVMTASVINFAESGDKMKAVQGVLAGIGAVMKGASDMAIAGIDQQIKAEQNRDGKSKESLAKIAQMEKKKDAMKKKAFEQNKKMQMATTIANTATGIMGVMSGVKDPIITMPLAMAQIGIIAAMGAAQLAVISKTSYSGGGAGGVDKPAASSLSIGKRGSSVDVSRGASGGELGYLRGQRGYGSSGAHGWTPTGGAAGLRQGYQTGSNGILVGEQGPEMIQPRGPYEVIPNDRLGGGMPNVNFTINAIDAAGVEDVLTRQQGHIINLLRSAANDTGEEFLEQVDTQVLA